jgi:hypothetical protein
MANGMPAPLESAVVHRVLKWLNASEGVKAIKQHGDAHSKHGTPDIAGSWRGRAFWIEMKRFPSDTPTASQQEQLDQWAGAGAITGCAWSLDGVKAILRAHGIDLDG